MLPKFTAKEREFFKKMGDEARRSGDMDDFFHSWKVIVVGVGLLAVVGGLFFQWLR